jgi:uncharacterized cupredoxin-like copper-binding protein
VTASLRRPAVVAISGALALAAGGVTMASAHPAAHSVAAKHKIALHVVESDYHIALSSHSGKAGTYAITDVNKSPRRHGLVVDGPGHHDTLLGYVKAHKTAHFTVKLSKGKYDIYCPVPGHKMAGMNTHLKIG